MGELQVPMVWVYLGNCDVTPSLCGILHEVCHFHGCEIPGVHHILKGLNISKLGSPYSYLWQPPAQP